MTLYCSRSLPFTYGCWFLVELSTTNFGQDAGFFTGALEATQRDVKWLIFFQFYLRHCYTYLEYSLGRI